MKKRIAAHVKSATRIMSAREAADDRFDDAQQHRADDHSDEQNEDGEHHRFAAYSPVLSTATI
jgi:hypothetical protein